MWPDRQDLNIYRQDSRRRQRKRRLKENRNRSHDKNKETKPMKVMIIIRHPKVVTRRTKSKRRNDHYMEEIMNK